MLPLGRETLIEILHWLLFNRFPVLKDYTIDQPQYECIVPLRLILNKMRDPDLWAIISMHMDHTEDRKQASPQLLLGYYLLSIIIKNISSFTSHKNFVIMSFRVYGILAFFFLIHSLMNPFWWEFVWMLTLCRRKFIILWCMTSVVIEGHKRSYLYFKIIFTMIIFLIKI